LNQRLGRIATVVLSLAIALIIGATSAISSLRDMSQDTKFLAWNGSWRVNVDMSLETPRQRALVALVGLFALRETEVVYFVATVDRDGNPLNSKYDYSLTGTVPEARYWSYTLYGEDDFLIPNESGLYAYNGHTIQYTARDSLHPELARTAQSTYSINISKSPKSENWLPSGSNSQLALTLRLYNPSPEVYKNLTSIPLPEIIRLK